MAAAVGTPIAIDAATLNKTRPSCARVKVEFDLLKSHPQHVVIQVGEGNVITSELQKIKIRYCTNCKLQGHVVDGCWNLKPALRPEKAKESEGGKVPMAVTTGKENPQQVEEVAAAHPISNQNPNSTRNPSPTCNPNPTRNVEVAKPTTQNPISNQKPNTTRNSSPNTTADPNPKISNPNPFVVLNMEDNEGANKGGEKKVEKDFPKVVITARVVENPIGEETTKNDPKETTKVWVTERFNEKEVPLNEECAEIPSNTSTEIVKRLWCDEMEEVMEEGEILTSEESTNSSSPEEGSPEKELATKENHMIITSVESAPLEDQEDPNLEEQQTNIAAEMGINVTQSQDQRSQPELAMNAEREEPTALTGRGITPHIRIQAPDS
ncbi:hypothetical protein RND71_002625 [Anisodus tanguticus]|uniref:Uncharacterized protein n=1 Tax=Anisodus tanguticus TaxID=243964 RepID=A0AAE1T370_9SOLA|nr:hypothetical protein RND71_002625 [Anisodus tanguticus]